MQLLREAGFIDIRATRIYSIFSLITGRKP